MSDGNENVVTDDATEGDATEQPEATIRVDGLGGVHLCAADRKRLLRIENMCRSVLMNQLVHFGKWSTEDAAKAVKSFLDGESVG